VEHFHPSIFNQSEWEDDEKEMLIEEGADVERTRKMLIATIVAIAVFIVIWWLATL
jgi:hypothetical protein